DGAKEKLIGLEKEGANISLEPGGQLELSGAPVETIHETCDEVNTHLREVKDVADEIGVGFIGLGAAPEWSHEQMDLMPKGRYKLMDGYMQKVGTMGTTMMRRTCTVQVNLDFSSETDMVQKLRVALALQPVATALFANSPFFEGKPNGHKSWRSRVWRDLDPARTGMLPFVFEEGFGFEAYADYALDVPMYFVYRDGVYHDVSGKSFRDYMQGKLEGFEGQLPTMTDWTDHMTTVFPEVRLKKFIEMRGADGGPWGNLCALPALWVGLIYDAQAQQEAADLIKDWSIAEISAMRDAVPKQALGAKFRDGTVQDVARTVLEICQGGLKRRARLSSSSGLDETQYIEPLHQIVATGRTLADDQLQAYHTRWNHSVEPIYNELKY
ncbi:MAG TPA: glutamate--cysteine ligase, partial [Rhodospirillaceae bacterium]|nr:glutamate--cysteine ligase [Rhodospirillaceae bacterium]